ncbi:MAG: FeoA family protein [Thermogutta sp.]
MIKFAWGWHGFRRGKAPVSEVVRLEQLVAGQKAQIVDLRGAEDVVHRLEEMGLRRGTIVRMFRPGNPCIVCLRGIKLGVRADDHVQILVNPLAEPQGHCRRRGWGWRTTPLVGDTPGSDSPSGASP